MRKRWLQLLAFLGMLTLGIAQAETITQYKTGIDLILEGERGKDWEIEYLYSDPKVYPAKVVYIRSDVAIGFAHNERNSYRVDRNGYSVMGGDEGVIRFKVDGDLNKSIRWVGDGGAQVYEAPFTFASLHYGIYGNPEVPVMGTLGPNLEGDPQKWGPDRYYWRGMQDSAGEEWHLLSVGDDDSGFAPAGSGSEWQASDGVFIPFVVNPKAPCLKVTVEGDAEFYTTPAKTYWVPKIHDQVTYIDPNSGSLKLTLSDLDGRAIHYRINGGDAQMVEGGEVVLTDADFEEGNNTLEYYCAGSESHRKVRTVVKNPAFPSAGTVHGDRFWGGAENWEGIEESLEKNFEGMLHVWSKQGTLQDFEKIKSFGRGERNHVGAGVTMGGKCALLLRYRGADGKPIRQSLRWGDFALKCLLEQASAIDPVGFEIFHSGNAKPSMEHAYRGYYDVNDFFDGAFTYDIVAGYFREDQHEGGMTPIQDYLIRDLLAAYTHLALWEAGSGELNGVGGMWDTARKIGGFMVMCAMPDYSTPYYGTSGLDGNTKTYPWTPFAEDQYTWKQIFVENDVPLRGWPNVARRFGVNEYLITEEGNFRDKAGYTGTPTMGHCLNILGNLWKLFAPEADFTNLEAFYNQSAEGKLMGLKDNSGPHFLSNPAVLNAYFPHAREVGGAMLKTIPTDGNGGLYKEVMRGGPLYAIWYDHDLPTTVEPVK